MLMTGLAGGQRRKTSQCVGNGADTDIQMSIRSSTRLKEILAPVSQRLTLNAKMDRLVVSRLKLMSQEFSICVRPSTRRLPEFDWSNNPKVDGRLISGRSHARFDLTAGKVSTFHEVVAGSSYERKLAFNKIVSWELAS